MRTLLSFCLLMATTSCVGSPTNSAPQHALLPAGSHLSLFIARDQATRDLRYLLNGRRKDRDAILDTLKKIASKDADQLLEIRVEDDLPARELMSMLKDLAGAKWKRVRIGGLLEGDLLDLWKPSELLSIEEKQP